MPKYPTKHCPTCTCSPTQPPVASSNMIDMALSGNAPRLMQGWAAMWRVLAANSDEWFRGQVLIQSGVNTGLAISTCTNLLRDAVNRVPKVLEKDLHLRTPVYKLVHYTLPVDHMGVNYSTEQVRAYMNHLDQVLI